MSQEKNNGKESKPKETLEERLRRIEAEAAEKARLKAEQDKKVATEKTTAQKVEKVEKKPAPPKAQAEEKVQAEPAKEQKKPRKLTTSKRPVKKTTSLVVKNEAEDTTQKSPEEQKTTSRTTNTRRTQKPVEKTTEPKKKEDKPAANKSTTNRRNPTAPKQNIQEDTKPQPEPQETKKTTRRSPKKTSIRKPSTTRKRPTTAKPSSSKETEQENTTTKSTAADKSQKKTNVVKRTPTPKTPVPEEQSDKQLVINSTPTQVEIALIENGKLVELHHQKTNNNFSVGDIFLGRIKRLMPGLNAAFVDIGHKKDAFLHYTDLGPKLSSLLKFTDQAVKGKLNSHKLDNFELEPEIIKTGKIDQVLNKRDNVLVQILKEPIGTKGPRLSCEITIPGRFLVLTPFVDVIAVSKKIGNSEERKRLKMLIESIKPKDFGVIVRTAAEGKSVKDLHEELNIMMEKWENIYSQLQDGQAPLKLLSELDKASSILRDILNDSFNSITVNDKELYSNIKTYMGSFAPDKVGIVNLYKGRKPIFDVNGVTKQIKSGFGKTATMSSGAYLVIEHTEAMHVIDVNSGHKMSSANQEEAVLAVNLESAEEIARQLRLRDIGGIIIVDFIDMRNKEHKQQLVTAMRRFMKKDRAQHTILPLSKFGLMQITRQRVRPEVKINTAEVCPSCSGTGKINPSILLTDDLERDLNFILQSRPKAKLTLHVHPYIEAYLKKGIPNIQMKWYMKFYKWIKIRSNADFSMTAYKFFDANEDEIRLQ